MARGLAVVVVVLSAVGYVTSWSPCVWQSTACQVQTAYLSSSLSVGKVAAAKTSLSTCFASGFNLGASLPSSTDPAAILQTVAVSDPTAQASLTTGRFSCAGQSAECTDITLTGGGVTTANGNVITTVCGPSTFTAAAMTRYLQASVAGDMDTATMQFLLGSNLNATKIQAIVASVSSQCAGFSTENDCASSVGVAASISALLSDGTLTVSAPPTPASPPPVGSDASSAIASGLLLLALCAAALVAAQ